MARCIKSWDRPGWPKPGQEVHIKSGQKLVLEAGNELTLKVGGSFIKLDASGITLVGGAIKLNSGGSPNSSRAGREKLPRPTRRDNQPSRTRGSGPDQRHPHRADRGGSGEESNPSTFYLFSE